ncbi:MAG TPA: hypothetical protein VHM00_03635 [Caldimonas sp.]|jgi:hypothetical protein|nr:hypothetical protein [Caldimonas sp.]HEX2540156.1 hypothetical protein [Caldimonas sp.]
MSSMATNQRRRLTNLRVVHAVFDTKLPQDGRSADEIARAVAHTDAVESA